MRPRKRLFIMLASFCLLVMVVLAGGLWYLVSQGPGLFSRLIFIGVAGTVLVLVPLLGLGVVGIVLCILSDRSLPRLRRLMRTTIDFSFPFVLLVGRLLGVDKERIESSFVEVNNILVRVKRLKIRPERILVLLPHCLQRAECRQKITLDIRNCKRCGLCRISDMIALVEDYGVRLLVATGGTQARRIVGQIRPQAIVAVACERELASGIHDVSVLPVLGIPNERPNGPCYNTQVDPALVRATVEQFLMGHST